MGPGGEETAAKRANPSPAGEDRLSALPDDVLVLILLRLRTPEAVWTSVLSRRWRSVWGLLSELRFSYPEPHGLRDALAASAVPLRCLLVGGLRGAPAESIATWLPAAARRLSGDLILLDKGPERYASGGGGGGESEERGALELPCFEKATSISLDLGCLGLSAPPAGVFARLTELSLSGVRFHGPYELGGAVSSPRCPCLQKLTLQDVQGLDNLAISSDSLKLVALKHLRGLWKLAVVAPLVKELSVVRCFFCDRTRQPVANISVPQLELLTWVDAYDPSSMHLGKMENLKWLSTIFLVYGREGLAQNRACLMFVSRVKVIKHLTLILAYLQKINSYQYLMEDMTILPDTMSLHLILYAGRHSFGACSFHILRMCPGIKRLIMEFCDYFIGKTQAECPQGCICGQPSNWKTEELKLNCLCEVEIRQFRGSDHELVFLKRLFTSATGLKRIAVAFNDSVAESTTKELCKMLRTFSRPEICMDFYVYQNKVKVLYASED
ncbi:hypothetical protein PAHAL_2G011200 [Panicum hallii]|uniref:F-box domain-containing protein n=1 Tax=Panicum hallii TaxID=206008 RepID=A0A2S3GVL1_9POAL|nr:uncharacterized protein LOC112879456 isoform X1 [Panicum hallii]PAN09232.1 hypothetical protein PAHAL_2G011200 [Panicum hallii]